MTIARVQLITPALLDGFLQAVEPALRRRATALLASGSVTLEQVEPASAVVVVVDGAQVRRVTTLLIAGRVTTLCDCPHRDDGPCIHRVVAVSALYTHMTSNPPQPWETLFALSDKPRNSTATSTATVVCFFLQQQHPLGVGDERWAIVPASVTPRSGQPVPPGPPGRPPVQAAHGRGLPTARLPRPVAEPGWAIAGGGSCWRSPGATGRSGRPAPHG